MWCPLIRLVTEPLDLAVRITIRAGQAVREPDDTTVGGDGVRISIEVEKRGNSSQPLERLTEVVYARIVIDEAAEDDLEELAAPPAEDDPPEE